MHNNGSVAGNLYLNIDALCSDIDIKCKTDNSPTDAIILNTTQQKFADSIAADASQRIWCWADYNNPSTGCIFEVTAEYKET
jgi:hypothetical protein